MLRDSQDAFGHQLYDLYKGSRVIEIVERDDGLIDPSESLPKYYLADFKDWTPREKLAAGYVHGRVLDIGCGGGRWSLYLQKKGRDVLGIDFSPLVVKVCKMRGLHNVMVKSITEVDSRLGMVAHNDPTNKEASDHLRGKSRGSGGLARIPEGIGLSQGKTSESRWQGR